MFWGGGVPVAEARDAVRQFPSGVELRIHDRLDVYMRQFVREQSAQVLWEGAKGIVIALGWSAMPRLSRSIRRTEGIGRG